MAPAMLGQHQEPADQANLDTGEAPENSSKRYHHQPLKLTLLHLKRMRLCSCNQFVKMLIQGTFKVSI